MNFESPADLLQKIQKKTRAFETAVSSGDLATAKHLAEECRSLYNQLARRVPHREQYYREQATAWKLKVEATLGNDMIGDEIATASVPETTSSPPSQKFLHKVFISYSKPDAVLARDLCSYLENEGIFCWIAPRNVIPGKNFPGSIIDAIDASNVVVLILSKSSDRSPHVIRELTRAVNRDLLIIPVRIEDILPSKNMTYLINIHHWFDAFPPPAQRYFAILATTIKTHLTGFSDRDQLPDEQGM